ncbi:hypothetical protein AcetOrient_orf00037p (plasmid) [Acetobacter orientalis]|uniref:Uncharacterized protein n=1 Tax=Acetobacter orientalis TaxID=146474 RepID=A0A2Z5ZMI4_9PROT|nr:hypothetical protein AcetOrient_orf00037p [Acetobacter orientalis]
MHSRAIKARLTRTRQRAHDHEKTSSRFAGFTSAAPNAKTS